MLRLSIVRDIGALGAIESAWADLLARSSSRSFALSPRWLLPWWGIFGGDANRSLCVGLFYRGDRLVGLAPFLARPHRYHVALPFRRLELLGSGEDERDEICSDYLGVVAEAGAEAEVAAALAKALLNDDFGRWDELVMPAMNGFDPLPRMLESELTSAGLLVRCEHVNGCPYIPLPKSWDDYLSALPSSARYLVRSSLSDFSKWANGSDRIQSAEQPDDVERGAAILRALHAERWTKAGGSGAFASTRFARFHADVMPELWKRGELELLWLSVRGEPVAALYNIVKDGVVYFYQSGRSLDLPKSIRPGIVLHAHSIRSAIELGRREYDFLAGASRYKLDLALATRPLVVMRATRPSLVESLRKLGSSGLEAARVLRSTLRDRLAAPAVRLLASHRLAGTRASDTESYAR
jgi:CelD/BcsL family acetyltransferase involved in cellulose biosynthesis